MAVAASARRPRPATAFCAELAQDRVQPPVQRDLPLLPSPPPPPPLLLPPPPLRLLTPKRTPQCQPRPPERWCSTRSGGPALEPGERRMGTTPPADGAVLLWGKRHPQAARRPPSCGWGWPSAAWAIRAPAGGALRLPRPPMDAWLALPVQPPPLPNCPCRHRCCHCWGRRCCCRRLLPADRESKCCKCRKAGVTAAL